MSQVILQVTIRGQIQGVGYRAWLKDEVATCGLEGWVRNRADGSVEALFAGPADIVAQVVALCRRGPSSARVEAVINESAEPDLLNLRRAGERFSVLPTV